jgi:hypothetical protein
MHLVWSDFPEMNDLPPIQGRRMHRGACEEDSGSSQHAFQPGRRGWTSNYLGCPTLSSDSHNPCRGSHPCPASCRLQQPLRVPAEERFWGCFSWVDVPLPQQLAQGPQQLLATATPALSDAVFTARQEECRRQLARIEVQELALPS